MKGRAGRSLAGENPPLSARENDSKGLLDIEHFLFPPGNGPAEHLDDDEELTPTAPDDEHV